MTKKNNPQYDIRALQLKLLDILMVIHRVCEERGLRYYLVDGSNLGAVRHGGFIPWDDDVDISMPRADYELLIEHADEWLPKRYEFICYERDPKYIYHFGKIQDSATTLIERSDRPYLGGIFVDVYPIDGVPSNKIAQHINQFFYRKLRRMLYYRVRDPYKHGKGPSSWFPLFVQRFFPMATLQRWMKKYMMRYDFDKSPIIAVDHNYGVPSMVSRTEVLGDPTPILFEGQTVMGLKDNDAYLKKLFGDYMQLPPEEKRRVHGFYYLDLEHPYRSYKKPEAKRYLMFASHSYAYSILRPIEREAWSRGAEVAWFLEETCPDMLLPEEKRIGTIDEIIAWNPYAIIAPGNWVYHFLPGIKVQVFHGYPMKKRIEKVDDHFTLRGWWDIYCTQGESSTPYFKELEKHHGYFKVYETGWPKIDDANAFSSCDTPKSHKPCILYAPTFSKGISSAWQMMSAIDKMASEKGWDWIITLHPKLMEDAGLVADYEALAARHSNVEFRHVNKGFETFRDSDLLLCDSSSLIVEYLMTGKPVVTFRNTHPGPFLIDVQTLDEIAPAIEKALSHPEELMGAIEEYTHYHERHRDGKNSARVLDAIDDFAANYMGKLKKKPLNLIRKAKLRWRLKFFK